MLDTIRFETKVARDGKLHLEVPSNLPPESEVSVTVSVLLRERFPTRDQWLAHVSRVTGSIPDLERPDQPNYPDVEPL